MQLLGRLLGTQRVGALMLQRRVMATNLGSQKALGTGKEMTLGHMIGALSFIAVGLLGLPMVLMLTREKPTKE